MKKFTGLEWTVMVLTIIGALNWGLFAIDPTWNIVNKILGYSLAAQIVYGLVGLSGLYMIYWLTR